MEESSSSEEEDVTPGHMRLKPVFVSRKDRQSEKDWQEEARQEEEWNAQEARRKKEQKLENKKKTPEYHIVFFVLTDHAGFLGF